MNRRLDRAALSGTGAGADPAPPRIVHLGLGAFARSHQAWYTWRADPDAQWGISGFTGRSPRMSRVLGEQDGLYTLVERGPRDDAFSVVSAVSEAVDGGDLRRFASRVADPGVAVVTMTVSERGYRLGADGRPDRSDPSLTRDLEAVRMLVTADSSRFDTLLDDPLGGPLGGSPTTAPGRLLLAIEARRRAGSGPLALVPCDNLASNGALLRSMLLELASDLDSALGDWIHGNVSFVSTSVDRITPATTAADALEVQARTGWVDHAAVVAEPFSDWVLSGEFPAGRPDWQAAGARFVSDVGPYERRKLWLLNGAHSILAAAGPARGHDTVASAIADDVIRGLVEGFWNEAESALGSADLDVPGYRRRLVQRFENPRIEHRLEQIANGAAAKLRVRIVPVALATIEARTDPSGSAAALAAWLADDPARAHAALAELDPRLTADDAFVAAFDDALGAHIAPGPNERIPR